MFFFCLKILFHVNGKGLGFSGVNTPLVSTHDEVVLGYIRWKSVAKMARKKKEVGSMRVLLASSSKVKGKGIAWLTHGNATESTSPAMFWGEEEPFCLQICSKVA